MASKLTADLEAALRGKAADDLIDVVMELLPTVTSSTLPKAEKVAALKAAFEQVAEPVVETVRQLGGEVTGRAWINRTLRVRVPAKALGPLATAHAVESVDAPRPLQAD